MKNPNLHGNAPDKSKVVLIILDVLNEFNFPEARALLRYALPMARKLAKLKAAVKAKGIPVIYANDNFGKWKSDREEILKHCLKADCLGKPVAELLIPDEDDYFVLKPKHSAFFSTTLDTLLRYLRAEKLIMTGLAGNICVLHTAMDAHIRDFHLAVPSDCMASNTLADNRFALKQLRQVMSADTRPSARLIRSRFLAGTADARPRA